MKKCVLLLLALLLVFSNCPVLAMSVEESEAAGLRDTRVQPAEPADAPKWVEYIPEKYQNPRTDFSRGSAIAELSVGILLTDLLLTAPIGIPMVCHSSTKLKNIGWADKKNKFFAGLEEANTITDADERAIYYRNLRKQCKMTDKKHKKQLKKMKKSQV